MKILVVDDSGVQRKMIMKIILEAGFNQPVLEAGNGQEAVQVLGANFKDIGLILCDWNMPIMSGIDFVEGVGKVPQLAKIPVIMVTTEGTEAKVKEARSKYPTLVGYVTKPFTADQLRATIQPFLQV